MKQYRTEEIRNIALVSHAGAGKTSLMEAMLFNAGATDRLGRVDDGSAVGDFYPDERERDTTINFKLCIAEWNAHKINIMDTPGADDFYGDLESALRVADALIVLVDATVGVEGGTEKVWMAADKYELPRIIFINNMDGEQASFEKTMDSIKEILSEKVMPLIIPIGSEAELSGVIDLVKMKTIKPKDETGKQIQQEDIPEELQDQVEEYRFELIEAAAEGDDEILEKYLEDEELTEEEILTGLKLGFANNQFIPVLCGSAYNNIGIQSLMNIIATCFPSPAEAKPVVSVDGETTLEVSEDASMSALVFKTTSDRFGTHSLFRVFSGTLNSDSQVYNSTEGENERIGKISHVHGEERVDTPAVVAGDFGTVVKLANTSTGDTLCNQDNRITLPGIEFPKPVITLAATPKREGDDEKISSSLARMSEEDPSFTMRRDPEVKQMLISGLGELHLNVILERMQSKYDVEAETETPKIPYKETIRNAVREIQYRYKKQSGGRGQFGEVWIHLEPMERGGGFEFVDEITGGVIPKNFIPSVEKGVRNVMERGILAGYPIVDVRVILYFGKTHQVDSSDIAFQLAGSMAFTQAAKAASPVLLEPTMNVQVSVPGEYMGNIISDLNGKRGRIMSSEQEGKRQIINAQVPYSEMLRYAIDLKSITSARGTYTMEFSDYEEVPDESARKVIAESGFELEEEEEE